MEINAKMTQLETITIESAKRKCKSISIDDDLIVFNDIFDLPFLGEPKRMNCLLVALCLKGFANYSVDTINHRCEAGDMMVITSGQVIESYQLSDDCQGLAIFISDKYFLEVVSGVHELSSLFVFSRSHPVFHLSEKQIKYVRQDMSLLLERLNDPENHFRRDVARSIMQTLLYDVSNLIYQKQHAVSHRKSRAESLFAEFIKLVEANFKQERRVGWYGLQMGITPKYLSEMVRVVSRRTPNEWIDYYVVMELCVLLRNTPKTVKQIAEMMNFPNQSFLGKFFKDHIGVSPSEYRRGISAKESGKGNEA